MGNTPLILLFILFAFPMGLILYNRQRCKGKMLCFFLRKDKSVQTVLCLLWNDFVLYQERAYDVYPDFVRLSRFPMGWPPFLQELVPAALYLEEDGIPLDWVTLDQRKVRAMELKSALDENFFRKMVHETAQEAGGTGINWRKILPIALLVIGVIGLIVLFTVGGNFFGKAPTP